VVDRAKVIRLLLVVYFAASVAIAVPLVFYVSDAGNLSGTTSGKVLAAALIAMGVGALGAARDPWGQRLMIKVLIVFTALTACAVVYRLAAEHHQHDPAWFVLPFAIAAPAVLAYFCPRTEPAGASSDSRPGSHSHAGHDT
jgi:peptidoglycan/LPS O-acetylase OafA/YrhL